MSGDCARSLRCGLRDLTPRRLLRIVMQFPILLRFLYALPGMDVRLSEDPTGLAIAEHLSLTRWGVPRFHLAQGVLQLPPDFASYLRGRRRQALRTNIRRARELGIDCRSQTIPGWTRPDDKQLINAAPVERWWATRSDGRIVGEAWLTVDHECALLHSMTSSEPYVRWMLHSAIVERLYDSHRLLLLTNSYDAPLMAPGQQYFQRLLGYSVARVRRPEPSPHSAAQTGRRRVPIGVLAIGAVLTIVGEQMLSSPIHLAGHRAIVWLTALIAVRVAGNRAGWATLVGAGAGLATLLLGATPMVSLAYFLCGVALDTELVLLPRLATSAVWMSLAGATVMFVTLIAPAFPTLGHQPPGIAGTIPPALGAIVFGAFAAMLGQRLGQRLMDQPASGFGGPRSGRGRRAALAGG
jgi:hypothetical protein